MLVVLWLLELVLVPVALGTLLPFVVVVAVLSGLPALLLGETELTIVEVDGLFAAMLDDAADPSGVMWTSVPLGYI